MDFGKNSWTIDEWVKKEANPGTYIDSYKYSKKYVQRLVDFGGIQSNSWVRVLEYHLIDGNWRTYYVISGNADIANIMDLRNVEINNDEVSIK